VINKLNSLVLFLSSLVGKFKLAFDIRIVFFLGGLISLGYGLFLFKPWIAFTVVGLILMVVGWLMEDKEKRG